MTLYKNGLKQNGNCHLIQKWLPTQSKHQWIILMKLHCLCFTVCRYTQILHINIKKSLMWALICSTYIGVDFGVAHSEGTLFVQQNATVSIAFIHFLFSFITHRDGGVGFLITPVNIDSELEKLCVCWFVSFFP